MNKGMSPALDDKAYFNLMTEHGTKLVEVVLKYYPELSIHYVKKEINE